LTAAETNRVSGNRLRIPEDAGLSCRWRRSARPLGYAQSEKLTDIDHFRLTARALLTKAINQTRDPCKCNTSPAGACSTDDVDVSRRCGKVHREHATLALLSLTRAYLSVGSTRAAGRPQARCGDGLLIRGNRRGSSGRARQTWMRCRCSVRMSQCHWRIHREVSRQME